MVHVDDCWALAIALRPPATRLLEFCASADPALTGNLLDTIAEPRFASADAFVRTADTSSESPVP
ncbi:MAG: hypothetical protein QF738_04875 [Rhodospirillales bacterium]|nr:hypothetical protein [Rhodospirillales bacterium]